MKPCTKCQTTKPLSEFRRYNRTRVGEQLVKKIG